VACVAKPDTILAWYRRLVAQEFDGSKHRQYPGRPPIDADVEALVVRMAQENSGWGYDRIAGALANLGHQVSDQTVGNILRRQGIAPAPKRSQITSWKDFLAAHMNVLAGCDLFTVEVLTWRGLMTYYVLFFIHMESRRVIVAGITRHPDREWIEQIGHSATQDTWGYLHPCRLCAARSRHQVLCIVSVGIGVGRRESDSASGQKPKFERFCRTMGSLCQTGVLVEVDPFWRSPTLPRPGRHSRHYHGERNRQGKGNRLLFPNPDELNQPGPVECRHRLGGLLKYYRRAA
jgi:putative transposase